MVGDNLQVRRSLVNDVMTGTLLPMTLVLPIAGLLVWLSVQRAMRPLDRMAGLLRQRQADDLRPVDLPDAPGELRPLSMVSMTCSAASPVLGRGRRSHGLRRPRVEDAARRLEDTGADRAGVG